jgi:hypothetical protein
MYLVAIAITVSVLLGDFAAVDERPASSGKL